MYAMVSCYFCILIAESVRRNEETKDATDKSIQECVSKWFTGAKDRNGGRAKRTTTDFVELLLSGDT